MNKPEQNEDKNHGVKDRNDVLRKVQNGELTTSQGQTELKRLKHLKRRVTSKPNHVWCNK